MMYWVPRRTRVLQIAVPEPDGQEHPLVAGSVSTAPRQEAACRREGLALGDTVPRGPSSADSQIPGASANLQSRPISDVHPRPVYGTAVRVSSSDLPTRSARAVRLAELAGLGSRPALQLLTCTVAGRVHQRIMVGALGAQLDDIAVGA
jgi:hypothetical protein